MNVLLWKNTNDSYILEVMMNQIDETQEQHMKFDLIYSVCATNHIIVSLVMGSSGLVKLKQLSPPTSHIHTHHTHTTHTCSGTPPPVRSSLCSMSNQASTIVLHHIACSGPAPCHLWGYYSF